MQEPTYLLLTALADAPRHGYAIIAEVAAISSGRVRMRTGTLYAALDRLQQLGLVRVTGEEVVDGRHRRYYTLTDDGSEALRAETARLQANTAEATRRLKVRTIEASA